MKDAIQRVDERHSVGLTSSMGHLVHNNFVSEVPLDGDNELALGRARLIMGGADLTCFRRSSADF